MRTFTEKERRNGEMAARRLSLEAQWLYENSDPFHIYETEGIPLTLHYGEENLGEITVHDYYVDGFGDLVGPLSFNELDWWLTDMVYTDYEDEFNEAMGE